MSTPHPQSGDNPVARGALSPSIEADARAGMAWDMEHGASLLKAEKDAAALRRGHRYLQRAAGGLSKGLNTPRADGGTIYDKASFIAGVNACLLSLRAGAEKYEAEARKLKLLSGAP